MNRYTLLLVTTVAGASAFLCMDALAQSAPEEPKPREYINWFEASTGGHYFGEDEAENVLRAAPDEQRALLADPDNHHRIQAKGQVAQLRDSLGRSNALTPEQERRLEEIFIAERDRQERELRRQYASSRITGGGSTWYGVTLLASEELGTPAQDQYMAQIENFSREQIAAVAPVLTAPQLEVYQQIQRERIAQQRQMLEAARR